MLFILFFIFIVIPVIEITVLIEVGEQLGALTTVALVILTAAVGASLVRSQGLQTLRSAQQKMQLGQQPGQEMIEGIMLAIAGVMLVTPGFVTDFLGLLLLLPFTRQFFANKLLERIIIKNMARQQQPFNGGFGQQHNPNSDDVIDGEFVNKDHDFQLNNQNKSPDHKDQ